MEKACFGGGCFWCTEAIFKNIEGVNRVTSGYIGGEDETPTYDEICTGETGHAEAVLIEFDELLVSFEDLLLLFFETHDPTALNRQGADVGTQYRSVVFPTSKEQKEITEATIKNFNLTNYFGKPVVTTIEEFSTFYKAEEYHQDYYQYNRNQPYCIFVVEPKLSKAKKKIRANPNLNLKRNK